MPVNREAYEQILKELEPAGATLVAVSKLQPVSAIQSLYDLGQRDFGENYVQELLEKQQALPGDIRWHFIGHLQTNKVKYILPFVHLIHAVDSVKLLKEINKLSVKSGRRANVLLQIHVAKEETKYGFEAEEARGLFADNREMESYLDTHIMGLMAMASNTDNQEQVRTEFSQVKQLYDDMKAKGRALTVLSMGMSGDYPLALQCGSNMVRIGSRLFGARPVI